MKIKFVIKAEAVFAPKTYKIKRKYDDNSEVTNGNGPPEAVGDARKTSVNFPLQTKVFIKKSTREIAAKDKVTGASNVNFKFNLIFFIC